MRREERRHARKKEEKRKRVGGHPGRKGCACWAGGKEDLNFEVSAATGSSGSGKSWVRRGKYFQECHKGGIPRADEDLNLNIERARGWRWSWSQWWR